MCNAPANFSSSPSPRRINDEHRLIYNAAITPSSGPGVSMKPNRSIPASTVSPVLIYPDVREAVAWLGAAFGFLERVRIGENHRAQLSVGTGAVIVGDVRHDRRPPRT